MLPNRPLLIEMAQADTYLRKVCIINKAVTHEKI